MSEYKVNDRVRVTLVIEGKLVFENGVVMHIDQGNGHTRVVRKGNLTVEVLEPEYEADALYMDAYGSIYIRQDPEHAMNPWRDLDGVGYPDRFVHRPLRKLVPEDSHEASWAGKDFNQRNDQSTT